MVWGNDFSLAQERMTLLLQKEVKTYYPIALETHRESYCFKEPSLWDLLFHLESKTVVVLQFINQLLLSVEINAFYMKRKKTLKF